MNVCQRVVSPIKGDRLCSSDETLPPTQGLFPLRAQAIFTVHQSDHGCRADDMNIHERCWVYPRGYDERLGYILCGYPRCLGGMVGSQPPPLSYPGGLLSSPSVNNGHSVNNDRFMTN